MEVNFSGAEAANIETGDFRDLARGESARCGGNDEWRKMEMKTKVKMVTCGDDGLAIKIVLMLLPGDTQWGDNREICHHESQARQVSCGWSMCVGGSKRQMAIGD